MTKILSLAVVAVLLGLGVYVYLRPTPSDAPSPPPPSELRAHLASGRDYTYFVGLPLETPSTWHRAEPGDGELTVGRRRFPVEAIRSYIVAYPNGQAVTASRLFRPYPAGVTFLRDGTTQRVVALDLANLAEARTHVEITYGPAEARRGEPGHYSTTIRNVSRVPIRVVRFAGYTPVGGEVRLSTVTGDFYSAQEFIEWYGAPRDGWIEPGASVTDPNNYGSGPGYWAYDIEMKDGRTLQAGAKIPN